MGCDQCIEDLCAVSWCACAGDSSFDDAGNAQGCGGYVDCIEVCLFPPADSGVDGGTLQQCGSLCAAAYTQLQIQEGDALLGCLDSNCWLPAACAQ